MLEKKIFFRKEEQEALLKKQWAEIDIDPTLDLKEKTKRKQNLLANSVYLNATSNSLVATSSNGIASQSVLHAPNTAYSLASSTVSPLAPPFYPTSDTVESVVG